MFFIAFSDWFRGKNRGLCKGITVHIKRNFWRFAAVNNYRTVQYDGRHQQQI